MELTSLEKTYYDEFSKSYGKFGNGIRVKNGIA